MRACMHNVRLAIAATTAANTRLIAQPDGGCGCRGARKARRHTHAAMHAHMQARADVGRYPARMIALIACRYITSP